MTLIVPILSLFLSYFFYRRIFSNKGMFGRISCSVLKCIGIYLIISPIIWVYPYYPYDKSVVTVKEGKVVYHPFGIWRQSNPRSIDIGGEVLLLGDVHKLRAINNGVIGIAQIQQKYHIDLVKYCDDPASPSCSINSSRWLRKQIGVADWNLLKSWIAQGMPEGEAKEELILKHLGYLSEKGITPEIILIFTPELTSPVQY